MKCAWQEFIRILPAWMRCETDKLGKNTLQELRLRIGLAPQLIMGNETAHLAMPVTADDLNYVINAASKYSPWSASTVRYGYITATGGHRIGICGEAVVQHGEMTGIKYPTSLCMRVARDFEGIAAEASQYKGSILIVGKPGSGKTTLLRDLIRQRSDNCEGCVAVVDERGEIFPEDRENSYFNKGRCTDILYGCSKGAGIDMVLRTMGPSCIAVDEITAQSDCDALLKAGWSGVELIATAHAGNKSDLFRRPVYRPIITAGLFDTLFVMQKDKSWRAERIHYGT